MAGTDVDVVGYVAGRERRTQLTGDPGRQRPVEGHAVLQLHEEDQASRAPLGVLQMHDEAVGNPRNRFDDGVELTRAEPDAAPVEGGIRAPGDHARAPVGDGDPVTMAPHPGEPLEVGLGQSGCRRRHPRARSASRAWVR